MTETECGKNLSLRRVLRTALKSVAQLAAGLAVLVGVVVVFVWCQSELAMRRRRGERNRVLPIAPVLENAFAGLGGEIQTAKVGVANLQKVDDPQALAVVIEATVLLEQEVEAALSSVAEGRMPEIMSEGDGLGELFVHPQRPGDGAGDLTGLECVGQPVSVVITLAVDEDLGLVFESAKGLGVDDSIAVPLEGRAVLVLGLLRDPAQGLGALDGVGSQSLEFLALVVLSRAYCGGHSSRSFRSTSRSFARDSASIWV